MIKKLRIIIFFLIFSYVPFYSHAFKRIQIVSVDKNLWQEIAIPPYWFYKDCQTSFIEYPEIIEPTIHYVLHFVDLNNNHKIEMRFNRFKGKVDKNAYVFDLTDFSERYIRIR